MRIKKKKNYESLLYKKKFIFLLFKDRVEPYIEFILYAQ